MKRYFLTVVILLLTSNFPTASAQSRWSEGEYGQVLSVAMAADERQLGDKKQLNDNELGNFVLRGRLISLNEKKTANVCFDTDLMRIAATWSGGFVKWDGAYKNMGPMIEGKIHFRTNPRPGWSLDGKWDDPRKPKEGPLPKSLAQFRGMYLHGDKVILSYRIADCNVLESLDGDESGDVVRRMTLEPTNHSLSILVCELDPKEPAAKKRIESGGPVRVLLKGGEVTFGVMGDLKGTKWIIENGLVQLRLPELRQRNSFSIVLKRSKRKLVSIGGKPIDLNRYLKGGPAHWKEVIETKGILAKDDQAYVVDELTPPVDNPWKSWMRFGAHDFFSDGRAAISTWDGDVWIVSGINESLSSLKWKRYATGLQHPLGLKIVNDVVYVAGRDQITRLHDLNNDNEVDYYECFNNDAALTPQRHEYVMDLQTDKNGNFYYCRSGHYVTSKKGENCCIMKVSPDGKKLEVFAHGFREPNGMSIGPDGIMTVGDNEGNGIPQTPLYVLKADADYGFTLPGTKGRKTGWRSTEKPLVWLPKKVDASAGGQVWVTSKKWGPLEGHLLHTSYGNCQLYHVMLDKVDRVRQAFVDPFPHRYHSGIMRARFHPEDGQLYLCGLKGWGTRAPKDGQFCRVRYTGKPFLRPVEMHVTKSGFELKFDVPLDRKSVEDDENWGGELADSTFTPDGRKRRRRPEDLEILSVKLAKDGRTVSIELENLAPAINATLLYQIRSADGNDVSGEIHGTIHRVPGSK